MKDIIPPTRHGPIEEYIPFKDASQRGIHQILINNFCVNANDWDYASFVTFFTLFLFGYSLLGDSITLILE